MVIYSASGLSMIRRSRRPCGRFAFLSAAPNRRFFSDWGGRAFERRKLQRSRMNVRNVRLTGFRSAMPSFRVIAAGRRAKQSSPHQRLIAALAKHIGENVTAIDTVKAISSSRCHEAGAPDVEAVAIVWRLLAVETPAA